MNLTEELLGKVEAVNNMSSELATAKEYMISNLSEISMSVVSDGDKGSSINIHSEKVFDAKGLLDFYKRMIKIPGFKQAQITKNGLLIEIK